MPVFTEQVRRETQGFHDIHDLTPEVAQVVSRSGLWNGLVCVFAPGATAGITTIEFESGALQDLAAAVERMAPRAIAYAHDRRWGDGNGFSHVRAALLGPSLTIPLQDGSMTLGRWQQIVLIDFDNRARRREIVVQIFGE